ncbi:hypothetical protein [Patiriisocius sp. Uisw_017]|jgi:hypothetical protein|uniref:hypothetical protein n=1 Tax=Patiriisocius sp. Uisw_017 TaxID=3230968 RepID=UPI0039E852F2
MKKQFITVFVVVLALTIFSCREAQEEKIEDSVENIEADIQDEIEEVKELESDSLPIELQENETIISE